MQISEVENTELELALFNQSWIDYLWLISHRLVAFRTKTISIAYAQEVDVIIE